MPRKAGAAWVTASAFFMRSYSPGTPGEAGGPGVRALSAFRTIDRSIEASSFQGTPRSRRHSIARHLSKFKPRQRSRNPHGQ
jgi:hypothetical protein